MSIYARVWHEFDSLREHQDDDFSVKPIIDSLSDPDRALYLAEEDLADELMESIGLPPDFNERVEREIYERGIETRETT